MRRGTCRLIVCHSFVVGSTSAVSSVAIDALKSAGVRAVGSAVARLPGGGAGDSELGGEVLSVEQLRQGRGGGEVGARLWLGPLLGLTERVVELQ
jgi:hypothetical protein